MSCYSPEGASNRTRETYQHYEKDIHKWDVGEFYLLQFSMHFLEKYSKSGVINIR